MIQLSTSKPRIDWIDIIKGLAIISVVYLHCHNGYKNIGWVDAEFIKWLTSFHMCLFFTLSGYFYNRNKVDKKSLLRKFKVLGTPYVIWGVLIGFLIENIRVFLSPQHFDFWHEIIDLLLFKKAYCACWFVGTLLGAYTVEYFITKLKSEIQIIAFHIIMLFSGLFLANTSIGELFYMSKILIATYFFELGVILRKYNIATGGGNFPIAMILIGAILSLTNSQITYSNDAFGNSLIFVFSSTFSIVGFILLFNRINLDSLDFFVGKINILKNIRETIMLFGRDSIYVLISHSFYLLGFRVIESILNIGTHSIPIYVEFLLLLIIEYYTIKYMPNWLKFSFGKFN